MPCSVSVSEGFVIRLLLPWQHLSQLLATSGCSWCCDKTGIKRPSSTSLSKFASVLNGKLVIVSNRRFRVHNSYVQLIFFVEYARK